MYDLIAIGNISIDLFFQGESLTHGKDRFELAIGGKYLSDYFYESLGGGAANVAIGVTRHNLKTAIMGTIGENQFKHLICKHLEDHGVSRDLCGYRENYLKISSILLSSSGERTIINYETPHEHIFETQEDFEKLKKAKMVYISNLPRVPLEERQHVLNFLSQNRIPAVLNFGIHDCRRPYHQVYPLISKANVLIVNAHEFCELTKHTYKSIDFHKDIRKYVAEDYDRTIIVTDGAKGSYAYFNGSVFHMPAVPPDKVIDTTGAGDGYTAGFIAGLLKHDNDIKKAMEMGAHYAVKIIQKVGAN